MIDNLMLIRGKNKLLAENVQQHMYNNQKTILLEDSKSGSKTLSIEINETKYYIHSKYNPLNEAEAFSGSYLDLPEMQHVLFIGTGLGYHIKLILDGNPHLKFSIFEPNLELLSVFIQNFNLSKYKNRLLEVFTKTDEIYNRQVFFKYYSEKTKDIILPVTKKLYYSQINVFFKELEGAMKDKKETTLVDASLQQRWTINSIINFPKILKTPNLLVDLEKPCFKNKPVIIVAAGPSLAEDLEYIRQIKKEGRAYIFAVGSAINALLAKNIMPDALFSVDPNPLNHVVAVKIKENNLSIPIVFGTSIGFETLENYPGKMISFMLNEDKISKYLLEYSEDIIVYDAVTVTNMTLQALIKLEMNPIIFAGQNMAYLNNRLYSEGINYKHVSSELTDTQKKHQKYVSSVNGEKLATSNDFLKMKTNLEYFLKSYPHFNYINTTKNGANIEGAKFKPIEDVFNEVLTEKNVVVENWHEGPITYDEDFAKKNFSKLENSFDELLKLCNKCLEYMTFILDLNKTGVYNRLEVYLTAFDRLFDFIQDNDFFTVIIRPMTRVQHEKFIVRSPEVAKAKTLRKKVELFDEIFGNYMKTIYATIAYIQPAFNELKMSGFINETQNPIKNL